MKTPSGLPTLFPGLVGARAFAERMFRAVFPDRLNPPESRKAVTRPLAASGCPVRLDNDAIETVVDLSGDAPW